MNRAQFKIIADHHLRKEAQRKATFDVMFGGMTPAQAERLHRCSHGSTKVSIQSVTTCYDLHLKLMGAVNDG